MHSVMRGALPRYPLEFLARSIRGVEWIVAAEIETRLAARTVSLGHREVRFVTDTAPAFPRLQLASADDVFLLVGGCGDIDHRRDSLSRLGRVAHALPWTSTLTELKRLRRGANWSAFSISASALGRRNYSRYEIEDRVAARVERALNLPYRATKTPKHPGSELAIRVHLRGTEATFGVRLLDVPLHRRRYRQDTCLGALHPPLAAAMGILAGLRHEQRLLDPFAGVGTVAIEASRLKASLRCAGTDISGGRIGAATHNARRAGANVMFAQADAARLPWADGTFDRVVTNVPWRRGVEPMGGLSRRWDARDHEIARVLDAAGRAVLLVSEDDPLCRGRAEYSPLTQCHRSWLTVRGQHPRLCVVARRGAVPGDPIDLGGMWGGVLARWHEAADTREV